MTTFGWTDWTWDPTITGGLALTLLLYFWVLRHFPPRGRQTRYFWAGFLTLVVALVSPIHTGDDYLFFLHMIEHMLLFMVAAPFLVLATPPGLLGWVYRRPHLRQVHRLLWSPGVAVALYNGALVLWHIPAMYDATLRSPAVHAVEHMSFIAVGLVFWGVIASPAPRRPALIWRLALLLIADLVNFLIGFILAFGSRPFYQPYTVVPRLWGLTPLADQQLGGLIMWVGGQMMYLIPVLILLYWFLWRPDARGPVSRAPVVADHP